MTGDTKHDFRGWNLSDAIAKLGFRYLPGSQAGRRTIQRAGEWAEPYEIENCTPEEAWDWIAEQGHTIDKQDDMTMTVKESIEAVKRIVEAHSGGELSSRDVSGIASNVVQVFMEYKIEE